MIRNLFLLALLALPLSATNFAFVQKTPNSSTGALSQAFGSNTTAGNIIVVTVYGASGTLSDSSGNTYTRLATSAGFPIVWIYVAVHIAGGADTVTASAGGGLLAMEYSSANSTYYACALSTGSGIITNPSFASTHEVMVVWGVDYNGTLIVDGHDRHSQVCGHDAL